MEEEIAPITPISSPTRHNDGPHDSPFADYSHSDSTKAESCGVSFAQSSPAVNGVISRLGTLQSQLQRRQPSYNTLQTIDSTLDKIEDGVMQSLQIAYPHFRHHMTDSGYADDEDGGDDVTSREGEDHFTDSPNEDTSPLDREQLLTGVTAILERVRKANEDLHQRFEEVRALNAQHAQEIEASASEALRLRSENDALKSTIISDHSELLFLKLQLKGLEVQAGSMDSTANTDDAREIKNELLEGIERMKSDMDDVTARLYRRRDEQGIMSAVPSDHVRQREDGDSPEKEGEWDVNVAKHRRGPVETYTISRRNTSVQLDGANDRPVESVDDDLIDLTQSMITSSTNFGQAMPKTPTNKNTMGAMHIVLTEKPQVPQANDTLSSSTQTSKHEASSSSSPSQLSPITTIFEQATSTSSEDTKDHDDDMSMEILPQEHLAKHDIAGLDEAHDAYLAEYLHEYEPTSDEQAREAYLSEYPRESKPCPGADTDVVQDLVSPQGPGEKDITTDFGHDEAHQAYLDEIAREIKGKLDVKASNHDEAPQAYLDEVAGDSNDKCGAGEYTIDEAHQAYSDEHAYESKDDFKPGQAPADAESQPLDADTEFKASKTVDDIDKKTSKPKQAKTPWQELWQSLTEFAGMSLDDNVE